jgi:hypothetical protein
MKGRTKYVFARATCGVRRAVTSTTRATLTTGVVGLLAIMTLAGAGCGRSPLNLSAPRAAVVVDAGVDVAVDLGVDLSLERAPDVPADLPLEATPDAVVEAPPVHPLDGGPVCHPQPETCNGVDDDCNGQVDENLPPIPCPDGGNRYCVSGQYSACPRRCEVCVPGSERECFTAFCTYWGTETCASDGRSFSACKEANVPFECAAVANQSMNSAALEQCCIDHGFCCRDRYDLDHDGDTTDMLGRCDSVECTP